MDANPIPPTFPFHIARAYSAAAPARAGAYAQPAPTPAHPTITIRASGDSVHITSPRPDTLTTSTDRLIAARVTQSADFTPAPAPTGGALPLYRHPADKNAAATGVRIGQSLDFNA